jgi:hypothetical protein
VINTMRFESANPIAQRFLKPSPQKGSGAGKLCKNCDINARPEYHSSGRPGAQSGVRLLPLTATFWASPDSIRQPGDFGVRHYLLLL